MVELNRMANFWGLYLLLSFLLLPCLHAAPGDECTVLIYTDPLAEPSSMKDTSATCPLDGGVRAFVLDMKIDGTGRPLLKEASPTPSEVFHCSPGSICKVVVTGYGLNAKDHMFYYPIDATAGEDMCPPPDDAEPRTVESHRQIKTGSSAVFAHADLPLSHDTFMVVFDLGVLTAGRYALCYISSLALRGNATPRLGDFRYYAGPLDVSSSLFSCDFDSSDCGMIKFKNNLDMDLDWTLHSGPTETAGTGPEKDHTATSPEGKYLYMKSPGYAAGSTATIMSQPAIYPQGKYCAKLAYHMYGDDVNSLRVYVHQLLNDKDITGDWGQPKWLRVGDHGREWQESGFEFVSDGNTVWQFVIEALAGFSEKGDIAVDDIEVTPGTCPQELLNTDYNRDFICGEVRLVSGNWSADKSWFIQGAVSCAGRGYSYDQLKGGWVPCCVPSYGEYTLVLKDQFGDGWGGSKVEFRFFDEVMTFGEDFNKDGGREKKYTINIGLLKILRAEGSEDRIGLEVQVMLPQAHLWCGAAASGSPAPSVDILKRYGIRSRNTTGASGGVIRMAIQNGDGDARMLKPDTAYDVYCYAQSASEDLGREFLANGEEAGPPLKMDNEQVAMSRQPVTTDGTSPVLTIQGIVEGLREVVVNVGVTEESNVWCLATDRKDEVKTPGVTHMKEKGFKSHVTSLGEVSIKELMSDTQYYVHCYAEDMAKPKPNGLDKAAIGATLREVMTKGKVPALKILSYKTFARGFSIFVEVDTPGNVWCGAAMAGSPYPSREDVRRVGATAEAVDTTKPVELEIRGVPPNTRYTVYCFASSKSGTREMTDSQMWETALEVGSFGKFCEQPTEPKVVADGVKTPFDPVTPTEEFLVKDYMMGQRELRLDGVYRINLYIDKDAIVEYLDNEGPFPPRFARVRVGTCKMGQGNYDQYKVGPLDSGNQRDLSYEKIAPTTFTDCGGYTPQGVFGRRLLDKHHDNDLSDLLKKSFGYEFGNKPECQDMTHKRCLEFGPVIYEKNEETNENTAWVGLRDPEGHHVPFYFLFKAPNVDMSNPTNPELKKYLNHHLQDVEGVWYDGRTYATVEELVEVHKTDPALLVTPKILKERRLTADADKRKKRRLTQMEEEAVQQRRRNKRKRTRRLAPGPNPHGRGDLEYRLAPEHVEPQGKRFTIRASPGVESYTIKYAGWEFVINNDRDTSLRLWNVQFNGDRVAFEMGMMEALAHYSVAERNWFFLDSWYGGLGAAARKLHKGVECPRTGETIFWDESVCVFEHDKGRALRSHWKSGELRDGAPHMALVVRQMLTVSNYDYITDWTFHLSGTMEGTVSFTGELYAGVEVPWFSSRQVHFGTQVTGSMRMGALHNHFAVWKIDFDVDGDHKDNSVYFKEVVPDPVRPGAHTVKDWFATTELDAAWRFNGTRPLHYFVVNEDHHVYGNVGGYLVKPLQTIAIPQPDFEVYSGPAAWTKYRVMSHVRKDGELDATLPRDNKYASRPATDVDRYIEDNEIIRHSDVVTWVSDGIWHLPHIEDMPLTVSIGNTLGWMVKPANFYTEDPSMDLHNAIAGDIKDPGTCAVIRTDLQL
eukprot:GHVS01023181.1.p1 GENE.GHVS01023181.1~~GHVS01023181.1.p1  ORF type:complete len:1571 (-),score=233.35 GHVS01023181.1:499-5211(-)